MTELSPITPSPELVEKWIEQGLNRPPITDYMMWFATQAARWGADQQLDQDAKWLDTNALFSHNLTITPSGGALRQVMRPKPPSLKEQALETLRSMQIEPCWINGINTNAELMSKYDILRRALEQLDD